MMVVTRLPGVMNFLTCILPDKSFSYFSADAEPMTGLGEANTGGCARAAFASSSN